VILTDRRHGVLTLTLSDPRGGNYLKTGTKPPFLTLTDPQREVLTLTLSLTLTDLRYEA